MRYLFNFIASKNYLNIDAIFVIFKRPIANRWYLICKKFIHNCALRTIDAKDSSDKQATANFVGLTWTCENTKVYLFICSFVNSRRVEHGAWSIVVDSISNVYPSIQPDYYDTKSRRGTRISYFRVFYRRLFSMLCESLQIVFWTVSFVCRIYIPSEHARSRAQLHTHVLSAFAFSLCIYAAFGQETSPDCFSRARGYRLWTYRYFWLNLPHSRDTCAALRYTYIV